MGEELLPPQLFTLGREQVPPHACPTGCLVAGARSSAELGEGLHPGLMLVSVCSPPTDVGVRAGVSPPAAQRAGPTFLGSVQMQNAACPSRGTRVGSGELVGGSLPGGSSDSSWGCPEARHGAGDGILEWFRKRTGYPET